MLFEVKVPAVGESVQEGEVFKWHKGNGEYVEVDEVLVELETDKATMEIVAEAAGIVNTMVEEGDTVAVGDVLAKIDTEGKPAAGGAAASSAPAANAPAAPASNQPLSPAVERMVKEHNLSSGAIPGTGRDGRILKDDVVAHMDSGAAKGGASQEAAPAAKAPLKAVPAAPTGPRGQRREKMSRLRQSIAKRLVDAQHTAAILTTFNEVDMTAVMALRKKYKESFKEKYEVGLGFMSFFVKACVMALQEYPEINAYIEEPEIIYNDYVDVGIAVSTDRGLIVPVVRDCQNLSFHEIEGAIMNYAVKGRQGKISLDDLTGGTFTITNGGVFGSLVSTPILTPPQSAILGMHKIEQRAQVIDGQVVARPMMYLALSYDHRIVDGKGAVGFLVHVKNLLEDPSRIMLGV